MHHGIMVLVSLLVCTARDCLQPGAAAQPVRRGSGSSEQRITRFLPDYVRSEESRGSNSLASLRTAYSRNSWRLATGVACAVPCAPNARRLLTQSYSCARYSIAVETLCIRPLSINFHSLQASTMHGTMPGALRRAPPHAAVPPSRPGPASRSPDGAARARTGAAAPLVLGTGWARACRV